MARCCCGLLTALWLAFAGMAWAADPVTPGNYKFTFFVQGQQPTFWLIKLDKKDGKLTGEVIANRAQVPAAKLSAITLKDDVLRLTLDIKAKQALKVSFEGKVPAEGAKKILDERRWD